MRILKMTRITLVNIGEQRKYGQIDEWMGLGSVGIESIATYCADANDVIVIDQANEGLTYDQIYESIIENGSDIVGFNPMIQSREDVGKLARRIKESLPNTTIVIGGYDSTFLELGSSFYDSIDVIVRGKGEIAVNELAKYQRGEVGLEEIQGIAYRADGKILENLEQRAEELSVKELPIPSRNNLNQIVKNNDPVSIYAGTGCRFKCDFCSTPRFVSSGRIERKLEDVLLEVETLAEEGITKFSFYDEDFFGVTENELRRADKIIEKVNEVEGMITFSFITTQGIHNAAKYGFLEKWDDKVNRMYVGVEGGCDIALSRLGNNSCRSSSKNARAIELVREQNIGLQVGFIMFNAYSDWEELEDSAKFLYDNDEAIMGTSFFHHLRPYKGTVMYDKLERENLLLESALDQMDLHADLPYVFKNDHDGYLRRFAEAICPSTGEKEVYESDKLNSEIYARLVALGLGQDLFHERLDIKTKKYGEVRDQISDLNYNFFMDSLNEFKYNEGKNFNSLRRDYLFDLGNSIITLKEIKEELS